MTLAPEAPASTGLTVERVYTTPGVNPYDEVEWATRTVKQTDWRTGATIFEQEAEFPTFWSDQAATIAATKYFRGALGTPQRESSLRQLIDRVVKTYAAAAVHYDYMDAETATVFEHELTWMVLHQVFAFNSPVWFNVGTDAPQQVSACFILSVDDSMDSILNWYREEGFVFKGGSGAGVNLSRIRSSKELLSSGGTASGPVSFMRGADASAGTIKSGGATRRAAKMVVLDVDHPDIVEFVQTKAREEDKIRALRDAGFDMDLGGKDIVSVQYQNANNSVRVTDEFMRAVEQGAAFHLRARKDGSVIDTVSARGLWREIAQAAWECADPGIQYDDTIQAWHTCPNSGRITASNPCSEFVHLDNSSCNLASLNLLKFRRADGTFDAPLFVKAVELVITAMEISISFADFPTEKIGEVTRRFRQLGIGYANLGALLMASGLAYDSPEGRALAASITSLLTAVSYRRSAEIAAVVGPYDGYAENAEPHTAVMDKHLWAAVDLVNTARGSRASIFVADGVVGANPAAVETAELAAVEWGKSGTLGATYGWRNSQASVLAPTGTIGFLLGCDTTGVEPAFALVQHKKLVGGGSMQIVVSQVPDALRTLGYGQDTINGVVAYVAEHGHVVGAPDLKPEHYPVFDCAIGERSIEPMGHLRMMAAAQPFLSGAISKTCNMPESATVDDIAGIYEQGWKLGLKALAVYRDQCKVGQPLSDAKAKKNDEPALAAETVERVVEVQVPTRKRMPKKRGGYTVSFRVGEASGYLTTGEHADGSLGEVFLKLGKQGSTLAGVLDALAISVSLGLQHGVPLTTYVEKFTNHRFEPSGLTDDPDLRMAQSILDYVFRRLAVDYLPFEDREYLGIFTTAERTRKQETGSYLPEEDEAAPSGEAFGDPEPVAVTAPAPVQAHSSAELVEAKTGHAADAPLCMTCGVKMRPAGACHVCEGCGSTSGCS